MDFYFVFTDNYSKFLLEGFSRRHTMRNVKGLIAGASLGLIVFLGLAAAHSYLWQRFYS